MSDTRNPSIFPLGQSGVEPPTLGFSVDNLKQAILHHFLAFIYQVLTKTIFGFVGLHWFIFGFDGYSLVTPIPAHLFPLPTPFHHRVVFVVKTKRMISWSFSYRLSQPGRIDQLLDVLPSG